MNRRHWLAALACAAGSTPAMAADGPRRIGSRQPLRSALQLPGLDGVVWKLAAHKGSPVLLNFWASWCEPCRTEMPSLERLAALHEAQGLQVMAVNYRESETSIRRFVNATSLRLPVLRDSDGAAAEVLGVHTFPTTIAIDRQGQVLFRVVGECDWSRAPASRWVRDML